MKLLLFVWLAVSSLQHVATGRRIKSSSAASGNLKGTASARASTFPGNLAVPFWTEDVEKEMFKVIGGDFSFPVDKKFHLRVNANDPYQLLSSSQCMNDNSEIFQIVQVQPGTTLWHVSPQEIAEFQDQIEVYTSPDVCQSITYSGADVTFLHQINVTKPFPLLWLKKIDTQQREVQRVFLVTRFPKQCKIYGKKHANLMIRYGLTRKGISRKAKSGDWKQCAKSREIKVRRLQCPKCAGHMEIAISYG